jgi:hypothetical protein
MRQILGALEEVMFPEFGHKKAMAKIDTGAYSGAIHCQKIHSKDGVLYCTPLDGKRLVKFEDFFIKHVISSNGVRQVRYFVRTKVTIRGDTYQFVTSLSDRSKMKWPILIGRRFLSKNNFLVDTKEMVVQ